MVRLQLLEPLQRPVPGRRLPCLLARAVMLPARAQRAGFHEGARGWFRWRRQSVGTMSGWSGFVCCIGNPVAVPTALPLCRGITSCSAPHWPRSLWKKGGRAAADARADTARSVEEALQAPLHEHILSPHRRDHPVDARVALVGAPAHGCAAC